MSETRPYDNSATQAERREVLKDTYIARAQADADLSAQGRFKRETTTRVTGVPSYPQLPASSPWSRGFDELSGPEPPFGVDVEAHEPVGTPAEIEASIEPAPIPQVASSPTTSGVDRSGEPGVGVSFVAQASGSIKRRRGW